MIFRMEGALVPIEFEIPTFLEGKGFRLEPLGPEHNERDHAAWMSSIDHIRSTPGFDAPDSTWPVAMSLERNLEDLVAHARDFEERTGFTYSILDGDDVIGCVYIYPAPRPGYDAEIRSWVRENRAEMDVVLWETLSAWIRTAWPFSNPHYAPRG
jgi:hypothetical protein